MSERTAQEHADTLRGALAQLRGILRVHVLPADDALDALLKEIERLTAERDEARAALASAKPLSQYVLERAETAEALAERRDKAAALARSELDWCIGYASTVEHKAWRERLLKRLHVARAALAEDASHQDAGEPGYGGQQKGPA